jgi:hypothetical protein
MIVCSCKEGCKGERSKNERTQEKDDTCNDEDRQGIKVNDHNQRRRGIKTGRIKGEQEVSRRERSSLESLVIMLL